MNLLISQIIGFCAFLIFIISIQQVNKKKILFLQIFSFGMYALEYLVINAYSGMIIFIINIIRSIVFYKIADKNSNINTLPKKTLRNPIIHIENNIL